MTRCHDDGALRAYLDDALPRDQQAVLARHVAACTVCREHMDELRSLATRAGVLLAPPPAPDPRQALARLQARRAEGRLPQFETIPERRIPMQNNTRFLSGSRRPLFAGLAALVAVVSLLVFPPVRAAADSFLQLFRARSVVFIPVDQERIAQLERLNFDPRSLFLEEPEIDNQAEPRQVGSTLEAATAAGFALQQPTLFPVEPTSRRFAVGAPRTATFRVNVENARQLLEMMDVRDVTLPDALGSEPVVAEIPAFVQSTYRGPRYELNLLQGRSPTVQLPEGVDLAQLGKAMLRLLGTEPAQAEALSQSIDWENTLLFPFPSQLENIRQVTVGGAPGLLMGGGNDNRSAWQLYWQRDDQIYMLRSEGQISDLQVIEIAESVR
jgi:hypothetical protein